MSPTLPHLNNMTTPPPSPPLSVPPPYSVQTGVRNNNKLAYYSQCNCTNNHLKTAYFLTFTNVLPDFLQNSKAFPSDFNFADFRREDLIKYQLFKN